MANTTPPSSVSATTDSDNNCINYECSCDTINQIIVDTENNTVTVQYKANGVAASSGYQYEITDAAAFNTEFLAARDSADFSESEFLSQKGTDGVLGNIIGYPAFEVSPPTPPTHPIDPSMYANVVD